MTWKARAPVCNKPCKLNPNDALAWARLAELHSSFGELDEALRAAQKAVALEPNLSSTQTVLGFAYLTAGQDGTRQRRPLKKPLRWIRPIPSRGWVWGWQRSGRAIWMRAAGISRLPPAWTPTIRLIRSYLGKAYYEEKRTGLD